MPGIDIVGPDGSVVAQSSSTTAPKLYSGTPSLRSRMKSCCASFGTWMRPLTRSTQPVLPVDGRDVGESVTEGTVTRWLKKVGDQVAADDPLVNRNLSGRGR